MSEATESPDVTSWRWAGVIGHWLREKWRGLTTGSVHRKVLGSAVIIGVLTLGVRVLSFFKEMLVAASFGTGADYGAFIVALLVPTSLAAILSSSLNAALIPTYMDVREREGAEPAHRLYTTILMWNTVTLLILSALLAFSADYWMPFLASGHAPGKIDLARTLMYWSLPIVVLTGLSTTWGALLNAGERFVLVALAPGMQPLGIMLILAFFFRSSGVYALLAGTVLGIALETALVGVALARRGHPLLPAWFGVTPAFRRVVVQYAACIGSAFLISGMTLVDQAFASTLGPRSNSALNYGSKIVSLILALGASALATAILPQLSKLANQEDWAGIRRFLKFYFKVLLVVTVPLVILLITFSGFLVKLIFQRGAFTGEDTKLVSSIQIFYFLRIPFATCGVLITRTLTALRANQLLLYASVGSFTLNALLDLLLIKHIGIAGITLSTSLCSVATFSCLTGAMYYLLSRRESAGGVCR